jgi:hypothetical protein
VQPDAETIALNALGWILSDDRRAGRLLALTGLAPDEIRGRIRDRAFLAEALLFLEGFEPDLIDCAAALGTEPAALVESRRALERTGAQG